MKKGDLGFILIIAILVIIIIAAIFILNRPEVYFSGPNDGTTSTRSFEGDQINKPVTVNLAIDYDPAAGTPFIDIIQALPEGFDLVYQGISTPRPDLVTYFPNTNPIQFTKFAPLVDETLSYVLIPNPTTLCPSAPGSPIQIDTLYISPPEESRSERGTAAITLASASITRTFSKSEVTTSGEQTIYLHVYPACKDSYAITENYPAGWSIVDPGTGEIDPDAKKITWTANCPGRCESTVVSYRMSATPNAGQGTFTGTYIFGTDPTLEILGDKTVEVVETNCFGFTSCETNPACQGEYCNSQSTSSCYGVGCTNSCTGRGSSYYCSSSCQTGDIVYDKGNLACGSGNVCCQDLPLETCEQAGGYCVENSQMQCPPGFTKDTARDTTCNNNEIPLVGNYPICCTTNFGTCQDNDGDGYGFPGDPSCPQGSAEDCNDNNEFEHPNQQWFIDRDKDYYSAVSIINIFSCESTDPLYTLPSELRLGVDCDDYSATIYPNAPEICNLRNDDCDLEVDEGCLIMPEGSKCNEAWGRTCSVGPPDSTFKHYPAADNFCNPPDTYCFVKSGPTCEGGLGDFCQQSTCGDDLYIHEGDPDCQGTHDLDWFCCSYAIEPKEKGDQQQSDPNGGYRPDTTQTSSFTP
jgi:hypothetical protein